MPERPPERPQAPQAPHETAREIRRRRARARAGRRARKRALIRALWLVVGLFFTGLGFVGLFLPVLPTVPFLIVAAAAFARSSRRLEAWLLEHRQFGPLIRAWRETGAIPRRAKLLAGAGSLTGLGVFVVLREPTLWQGLGVGGLIAAGLSYVFTRPDG